MFHHLFDRYSNKWFQSGSSNSDLKSKIIRKYQHFLSRKIILWKLVPWELCRRHDLFYLYSLVCKKIQSYRRGFLLFLDIEQFEKLKLPNNGENCIGIMGKILIPSIKVAKKGWKVICWHSNYKLITWQSLEKLYLPTSCD